ncbi:MAG: acyl-CoA dehydrogenase family protein [Alphaproteobacteria bacterium]
MQFSFTEEQGEFRDVLRRFLADRSATAEVRRLMATDRGWEPDGWRKLNQEMGLTALAIPEDYGGQGFGVVEHAIVMEEAGRALLCAPYFATTALAVPAILTAGTEDQKRALLPAIAAGDTVATLAHVEDDGVWDGSTTTATATEKNGGWSLDGTKSFVVDGHTADLIVVLASAGTGLSLFTVAGDADGLTRRPLTGVDPTRKLARLELKGVAAEPLGTIGKAAVPLAETLDQAAILLANEMVGGAERLREDAQEYVAMRMQFGRAIASFQAIKHRCADMLLDVEMAKSAAYAAASAAADGDANVPALASLAKACAADTYMATAVTAIQLHGGIGFTWDNDTHLWFKRAKASEVMLGDPTYHRELMLQRWHEEDAA